MDQAHPHQMTIHSLQASGIHIQPAPAENVPRERGSGDVRIRDGEDQTDRIEQLPLVDQFILNGFGLFVEIGH